MEANLAVLIDFENIAAGTEKEGLGRFDVETLIQRIKDKGRILVARSYADWGRFSRFKQSLLTANVTMMELTSHGMQDKNRADIAMVVDALELAFTRAYVDTYVVVSGDSDFTPLVLKLRELNKRVIGIGTRKSTSRLLIQACDEFMFYDTVVQPAKAKRRKQPGQSDEVAVAFTLIEEAINGLQRENPEAPLASVVKSAVLRKSPDFSESDLGFPSFARLLEAAQDAGIVRIIRDTKSGGYRVDTGGEHERQPTEEILIEDDGGANWKDEYLPDGVDNWLEVLETANLPPLAAPTRLAVLEALEEVVGERSKKRRKTTAQFVRDDVKKKLRRTHPDLPAVILKGLLDALMQAGELIHRDGTAIRSGTAPFTLMKDAEGLNESLIRLYLAHLKEGGCDLSDTSLLAELMYGDRDRRRNIEETLAYLTSDGEAPVDDLDLDDLLVSGGERFETKERAEPVRAESGRSRDRSDSGRNDSGRSDAGRGRDRDAEPRRNKDLDADLVLDGEPVLVAEPVRGRDRDAEPRRSKDRDAEPVRARRDEPKREEPKAEAKRPEPKRDEPEAKRPEPKRSEAKRPEAKRSDAKRPELAAADAELDLDLQVSETPKKPRRSTAKPKKETELLASDLDLLVSDGAPAPEKKPRRSAAPKAKKADEVDPNDLDALLESQP